jgi:phospho-N-acetylmuramoyl-pentapeptide-transferase
MLYYLLFQQLFPQVRPFRVFQYVTFRTAFASLTALFICVILGPWLIARLREFQIGQHIREDGPKSHAKKAGTPTMGGILIIISIVAPTLLWADLRNPYIWVALLGLVGYGAIGFFDDYAKVRQQRNLGFTARKKFLWQLALAFAMASLLLMMHARGVYTTNVNFPFFK